MLFLLGDLRWITMVGIVGWFTLSDLTYDYGTILARLCYFLEVRSLSHFRKFVLGTILALARKLHEKIVPEKVRSLSQNFFMQESCQLFPCKNRANFRNAVLITEFNIVMLFLRSLSQKRESLRSDRNFPIPLITFPRILFGGFPVICYLCVV